MDEQRVTFSSGSLRLEGLYLDNPGPSVGVAVICHPHPQYGGSMHNNVVEAALEALWDLNYSTLRFNFRGVGESEGEYGDGVGEADDAIAAVAFARSRASMPARTVLAGYSFGAMVALGAGRELSDLTTIIAVAPPVGMIDLSSAVRSITPIVLVAGDADSFCPPTGIRQFYDKYSGPKVLELLAGADHFFGGFESKLTATLRAALTEIAAKAAS
jgi:alpha/beta superfamily hydrolase